MKGVILAGGLGTRLQPLTLVTNKHLLPVYDRPMIYYPIQILLDAGITEILLVTGGEFAGDFLKLLKNGKDLGIDHLEYTYQEGARAGIADALKLAEDFAEGGKICIVLGDQVIEGHIKKAAAAFRDQPRGAKVLLKEVEHPERFGVARFDDKGRIAQIFEKPADPPSRYAVTGIYFYDDDIFDICSNLKPSARGELEITDVNNVYLHRGDLSHDMLDGWWTDAGTFQSLLKASNLVKEARGQEE